MIKLMERFPIIVTLGAALIGWVAGDAITHDLKADFYNTTELNNAQDLRDTWRRR